MNHVIPLSMLLLVACAGSEPVTSSRGSAPPAPEPAPVRIAPAPTTAPAPAPAPEPPPDHPIGAIAIACTVRAEIEPVLRRGTVHLRFVLRNLGPADATVTLQGRCPGGVVELAGLPPGFDPMHRCRAGACVQPTTTATYTIPPRGAETLGEATLAAKGDACNPPLPAGSTFLQAAVNAGPEALHVCSGAMVHVVHDPRSGALRLARLTDEPVPATPTPKVTPAPPQPPTPTPTTPTTKPRKDCPACGIGCPNGIPSTKRGPDGCPSCSCESFDLRAPGSGPGPRSPQDSP